MSEVRSDVLLEVRDLTMDFGGLRAVDSVSLEIRAGEIVALIGPNGAGKTTFFNCVTGIYDPTKGDILVHPPGRKSQRINGLKPNTVTTIGMARTFQNIRLFPAMTVLENVMIGRHCRTTTSILGAVLRGATARRQERETVQKSYALLEKVGLAGFANEFARNLPYGAQRRLEIARALATEPFLLLLDEPAAGMNPHETHELDELIVRIRQEEAGRHPAHRTRHEAGDEHFRSDLRHGVRQENRRRDPAADQGQSAGDRGLPRGGSRCLNCAGSIPSTATSRP